MFKYLTGIVLDKNPVPNGKYFGNNLWKYCGNLLIVEV
jgi:hypothetical protein